MWIHFSQRQHLQEQLWWPMNQKDYLQRPEANSRKQLVDEIKYCRNNCVKEILGSCPIFDIPNNRHWLMKGNLGVEKLLWGNSWLLVNWGLLILNQNQHVQSVYLLDKSKMLLQSRMRYKCINIFSLPANLTYWWSGPFSPFLSERIISSSFPAIYLNMKQKLLNRHKSL